MPARTDEELMIAYRDGDGSAFRELFERFAPVLRRIFRQRLDDVAQVDDLVQQTFLQLHRARNDFQPGALLKPWLFTIAFNLARERYRREKRRPRPLEIDPDELGGAGAQQRFDLGRDLAVALEGLPVEQREVILLHWRDGLSFPEIAAIVAATPTAVRVRAHRGYVALRRFLDPGNPRPSRGIREEG